MNKEQHRRLVYSTWRASHCVTMIILFIMFVSTTWLVGQGTLPKFSFIHIFSTACLIGYSLVLGILDLLSYNIITYGRIKK